MEYFVTCPLMSHVDRLVQKSRYMYFHIYFLEELIEHRFLDQNVITFPDAKITRVTNGLLSLFNVRQLL
jgi:hypothetical protein